MSLSDKTALLEELESLGIRADGRKIRNDKGKTRSSYIRHTSAPRADAGQKREKYNSKSADYNRKVFEQFLRSHTSLDSGDDLVRDDNMIFPPNINSYYKSVKTKTGYSYRSSVKRANHPEYLRWKWYFAEYENAPTKELKEKWKNHICKWYFIKPRHIDLWTYDEWAWCYYRDIAGAYNYREDTLGHCTIYLDYDKFVKGQYGQIEFDNEGEIIWKR